MFQFFKKILGDSSAGQSVRGKGSPGTRSLSELARRLGMSELELRNVPITYQQFQVPKRAGGTRKILAPAAPLKAVQRRILRRLLARLRAHPCATGFERGHSIVTNALPHVGQSVVIKLDLKDFFTSTPAKRVEAYFRSIGWDTEAAEVLTRFCTHQGSLPQGAPTSPRLSNLVNHRLDSRIAALVEKRGVSYSRYADDITLSAGNAFPLERLNPKTLQKTTGPGASHRINDLIHTIKQITAEEGYKLHTQKKLRIARRHDRQIVTGIVVNDKPNLPRSTRRRLRAIEHHLRTGMPTTLTEAQLAGWRALSVMVRAQGAGPAQQSEVT